jgi:hypothetical protein
MVMSNSLIDYHYIRLAYLRQRAPSFGYIFRADIAGRDDAALEYDCTRLASPRIILGATIRSPPLNRGPVVGAR